MARTQPPRDDRVVAETVAPWLCLVTGVVAFLAICALLFSFDTPWTLRGDNRAALFPLNLAAYQSWARGFAPEWSGGLWGGFPLLSDPTSGSLYWPNLLIFSLTPEPHLRAYDLSTAFHAALLAAGSVRLLQALGASSGAALFCGALVLLAPAQQWSASAILHSYAPLAWWPWLFLAAEQLSRSDSRVLGGAMALGWVALASQALWYPEFALYSGVIAGLWLLTRNLGIPLSGRVARAVLLCAGGLVIAAPQLLPTALYLPSTGRSATVPFDSASLVSFRGSLWTLVGGDAPDARRPQFLGAAALALAALAVARSRPRAAFLSAVGAVALVLALGPRTPVYSLLHEIPPFDKFRSPMKFFQLTEFAVTWLAGLGASELLRRGQRRWVIALGLTLMVAALAERARFDFARLSNEARLPGGREAPFATLHQRLRQSGLIEAALAEPGQPPPRVLELVGLGNLSILYGLEQLTGGPTPLRNRHHRALLKIGGWSSSKIPTRRTELDLWGVHFLLTRADACEQRAESEALNLLAQNGETCLFENPSRPPRYALLETAHSMPTWESMVSFLKLDPSGPVPLLRPDAAPERDLHFAGGSVGVSNYRPGAVQLRVHAAGPALLLVRESFDAGWHARVDGAETPIHPAAGAFFALPVPAGEHEVRLRYRTPGLRLGLLISCGWIIGATGLWVVLRRSRAANRARAAEAQPG